ncbi:MAG TPA: hypothetical protein VGI73_15480 [Solirubrobacterales bacterium]
MAPKRKCIFCGGGPLTKEHIFGEWFRKLVGIQEPKPGSVTHHVPGKAIEFDFEAIPVTRTARVVCAACNNGWMAELEERAAEILTPLLHGQSGVLSENDLGLLARWAFKTAFVIDAASPGSQAGFPRDHRELLRESGELPPRSAVWMTTWPGSTTTWTAHWGCSLAVREGEEPEDFNTYGATFALGPIAFRVYATTQEPIDPEYFHELLPGIFKIHPRSAPIEWVGRFWITAEQLEIWAFSIPRQIQINSVEGAAGMPFWMGEESAPIRGPE